MYDPRHLKLDCFTHVAIAAPPIGLIARVGHTPSTTFGKLRIALCSGRAFYNDYGPVPRRHTIPRRKVSRLSNSSHFTTHNSSSMMLPHPLHSRAIHGQEFDNWAANLLAVLQSRDRGGNCLAQLRQMLVLVGVTKYNRK